MIFAVSNTFYTFFPDDSPSQSRFPSIHERVILLNGKELIIKKARIEDYENVLSIGVMYNGMDYLPALYKSLLQSAGTHMFIGCIDGETVRCYSEKLILMGSYF